MTKEDLKKLDREFRESDGPLRRTLLATAVRPGDSVTIETPQGGLLTGTARILGKHGIILDGGGRHGTPLIADATNVVSVRPNGARKPLEVIRSPAPYQPLSDEERKHLETQSQAFYWAGHMAAERLPNPVESMTAIARLYHDDVMTGRKQDLGQKSFAAAHANSGIPADKWIKQVRKAQAAGYPIDPKVIAEADTMETQTKKATELQRIIHPVYGPLGYTTPADIEKAKSRGSPQVILRNFQGERLIDVRDRLPAGPRAAFDKLQPATTIHVENLADSDLVPAAAQFKLQRSTAGGWEDVRTAEAKLETFITKRQALAAARDLPDGASGAVRVVTVETPQEHADQPDLSERKAATIRP